MVKNMKIGFILLIVGATIIFTGSVTAKMYTWTDSNGVKHFSTVNIPAEAARQASSDDPCADYANDYNMKFVTIYPGTFIMGSPPSELGRTGNIERRHKVTITRPFQIQVTEVTQKQWQMVMGKNPSFKIGDQLPVNRVSWSKVQDFIRKLNMMDPEGNYRLPTEAEWEYACRAGTRTAFSSGPATNEACLPDPNLETVGWYCGNSDNRPHPVARKLPNAWGLYDMHGNVNEFCQDHFDYLPLWSSTDPKGPKSGQNVVVRGGGYLSRAAACRSAWRGTYRLERTGSDTGFRLARTIFCKDERAIKPSGSRSSENRDIQKGR